MTFENFQLKWMADHGYTITDLVKELERYQAEVDPGMTLTETYNAWLDDSGFGGSIWPCRAEAEQCGEIGFTEEDAVAIAVQFLNDMIGVNDEKTTFDTSVWEYGRGLFGDTIQIVFEGEGEYDFDEVPRFVHVDLVRYPGDSVEATAKSKGITPKAIARAIMEVHDQKAMIKHEDLTDWLDRRMGWMECYNELFAHLPDWEERRSNGEVESYRDVLSYLPEDPNDDYPIENEYGIWTDGDKILCPDRETAEVVADWLENFTFIDYAITGSWDEEEDKRDGTVDKYTGLWYVTVD